MTPEERLRGLFAGDGRLRLLEHGDRFTALIAIDVLVGATIVGLALAMLLFAPERHRDAVRRLTAKPLSSLAIGALALYPALVLTLVLLRRGAPGRFLLLVLVAYAVAAGVSVAGRMLGARAMPERGPMAQTVVGLAALLLPCAMLIGLPVLLVAAPLGFGAWLSARRE